MRGFLRLCRRIIAASVAAFANRLKPNPLTKSKSIALIRQTNNASDALISGPTPPPIENLRNP